MTKPIGVLVEADARRDAKLRAISIKRYKTLMRWLKNPKTKSPFDITWTNKGRGVEIHWSAPFGKDPGPSYLIFDTDDRSHPPEPPALARCAQVGAARRREAATRPLRRAECALQRVVAGHLRPRVHALAGHHPARRR